MLMKKMSGLLLALLLVSSPFIASRHLDADTETPNHSIRDGEYLVQLTSPSPISIKRIKPFGEQRMVRHETYSRKEVRKEVTPATPQPAIQATSVVSETPTATGYVSHLSPEEAEAKEFIAQKESGGSYTAQNGIFYGRYQLTDTYLNGDYSPENQERVADQYVAARYGSWVAAKAFWLEHYWY